MKILLTLALLPLSACAGRIDAPSLAPRPVEATRPDEVAATPPAAPDADQTAAAARMIGQARAADAVFEREIVGAARPGAIGSESWIAAQSARSAAEVARGPAIDALKALDGSIAQAIDEGRDASVFLSARAEVQAIVDRQDKRLDALTR